MNISLFSPKFTQLVMQVLPLAAIHGLSKSNATYTLRTKGWWTYEFCFRKHVVQYHEGSRKSSETLLGVYERDYDWDNSSQVFIYFSYNENKPKYHSQFYINGSVCDITGKHRKSEVQFLCSDTSNFHIISVDEPETCVYLLKISSPTLCMNERFTVEAPVKTQDIMCHPALSESDYRSYQACELITYIIFMSIFPVKKLTRR
ncbi:unnamed protein product [Trichobilharzia regenti]|nr:unnamed protein product [Trichobilharzia regenti]